MSTALEFFFISLLATILGRYVWAQDCNTAGLRKFDSNIAKLITIGNSGRSFPEKKGPEVTKYCGHSMDYISEIESYKTRCMSKDGKQTAGVLIYAVKNIIKQVCKKDSPLADKIMTSTPCANLGSSEINKCYTKLIDGMLGIQNEPDDKKKIPLLCCEYHKLFPCMEDRLKRVSVCDETKITTIVDFVKGVVGNMIDLFCNDYSDSDKCARIGEPPKKKRNQRRTKSFALPMMDVLKSFEEE